VAVKRLRYADVEGRVAEVAQEVTELMYVLGGKQGEEGKEGGRKEGKERRKGGVKI
jgi:hypothetical protein